MKKLNRKEKQKNKRRGRSLASLLLAVTLTLGCICTGTVQVSAATRSSLVEQTMNRSSAASNDHTHNWDTDFGNVGHIEYMVFTAFCGCGAGPMSFSGYLRHRVETGCNYNWWATTKDYGKSLTWRVDDYKVCTICGEIKITKPKNPDTNYLGSFNTDKITVNNLDYKVTNLLPENTVTLTYMDDAGKFGNYSKAFTVPNTVKKKIRIKYGDVRETETMKVTGIGSNAFKDFSHKKLTLGTNIETISKNAFKGISVDNIVIKSTKLTSKTVADKAFNGLGKKTVITVPKSKLSAYKKLFKQKGFKGTVKAGTWKESSSSSSKPASSTKDEPLEPQLIEKIDILDGELTERSISMWLECVTDPEIDRDWQKKNNKSGIKGDIANTMDAILAYMNDDVVIEVSKELGGSYTIKEFLEAYCKKDPRNDVKQMIAYAANLLQRDILIFG